MVGLPTGTPAPCDGILVPPDQPDACDAVTASLMSCRRRLAGAREQHRIELAAAHEELAGLERAKAAERAACRDRVAPERRTDWSAVAWGVVAGMVTAGLIAGGAVALSR
jgi:hypothetical protein